MIDIKLKLPAAGTAGRLRGQHGPQQIFFREQQPRSMIEAPGAVALIRLSREQQDHQNRHEDDHDKMLHALPSLALRFTLRSAQFWGAGQERQKPPELF